MLLVGETIQRGDGGDHRHLVLLANLSHNLGHDGHMTAHHDVDVLLCNQAFSLGLAGGRVASVVAANNFQRTAIDAASRVDLVDREFNTAKDVRANGSRTAGHRVDGTDLDGLSLGHRRDRAGQHRDEHGHQAQHRDDLLHVGFLLKLFFHAELPTA